MSEVKRFLMCISLLISASAFNKIEEQSNYVGEVTRDDREVISGQSDTRMIAMYKEEHNDGHLRSSETFATALTVIWLLLTYYEMVSSLLSSLNLRTLVWSLTCLYRE